MRNAVIRITRGNEYLGMGRKLKVFIDNTQVGDAGWNETSEIPITTGQHSVYVKMDWCRSAPIAVELGDGGVIEFEVTIPSGTLAQTFANFTKASRSRFFGLKERIEVRAEAAAERTRQAPQRPAPVAAGAAPEAATPILEAAPAQAGPTCSSCGAAVQATDVFCESCGARQAPQSPAPAAAGAAPEAATPILEAAPAQAGPTCSSCGTAVQATDVYCESCGARLGA